MGKMDYDKWAQSEGFRDNRHRNDWFAGKEPDCLTASLRGIAVTALMLKIVWAVGKVLR